MAPSTFLQQFTTLRIRYTEMFEAGVFENLTIEEWKDVVRKVTAEIMEEFRVAEQVKKDGDTNTGGGGTHRHDGPMVSEGSQVQKVDGNAEAETEGGGATDNSPAVVSQADETPSCHSDGGVNSKGECNVRDDVAEVHETSQTEKLG